MSFLEYVIVRLVGPPQGDYYPCPFKEHANPYQVVVNEPLPGKFIKARCHRGCGPGPKGCFDAIDAIKAVLGVNYAKSLIIQADLMSDYHAWLDGEGSSNGAATPPLLPMGRRGGHERAPGEGSGDFFTVRDNLALLGVDDDDEAFRLVCRWAAIDPLTWGPCFVAWERFREWCERMDAEHLRACDVPECDAVVCRLHRGLDPLTPEELEVERPAAEMRRHQRNGRARR